MKVLKKATQKNVILNKDYYSYYDVRELLDSKEVCFFDDDCKECYDYSEYVKRFYQPTLRIFLEQGDEIKVELSEDGIYINVLIKANGNKYYINL